MESVEFAILDWIQQHLRCGFLDTVLPAVSWICNHGEVWIILAAVLLAMGAAFFALSWLLLRRAMIRPAK